MSRPALLVVSPVAGGHHAEYLRWTVAGLAARGVGPIAVAAPDALWDAEPEALADAQRVPLAGADRLASARSLWQTGRATGALVASAAWAADAPRVFLPSLDHAQLALATGLRLGRGVRVSGVLLRATPHDPTTSVGDRLRRLRKTALLRLAARSPHLGAVLALDPDAVGPLRLLGLDARWLPDPVAPPSPSREPAAVRDALGIEDGRRLLLLFGSLEERKGVFEVLEALARVPPEAAGRLAIAILGRTYDDIRPHLRDAVAWAQATPAQVVFEERFVPNAELDDLVAAADVVLAPYRAHVGSSGVVLRAAAAATPLLATDEGMVGREVRRHRLGQTVDPGDTGALASALARAAAGPSAGFDAGSAAAYAEAHAVDRFVDAIHAAVTSG